MKKWQDFVTFDVELNPHEMKSELETISGIKVTRILFDSIMNELYLDFKFEGYRFSFHNPYGGVYGYWFFYKIRRNNPEITQKLKKLLQDRFEV